MNILDGIRNFLQYINDNWVTITIVISLLISIANKLMIYLDKTDAEKIAVAKAQIHEMILKMITDAEEDYEHLSKAGSVKRSQVIGEIFAQYPILSKVISQDELIQWIDNEIDNALNTLREIIEMNKNSEVNINK